MFFAAIPIVGKIASQVLGIFDKLVEDKDQAARLKHEFQVQLVESEFSFVQDEIEQRAKIVAAEAEGQSWLQRNWRPILMLTFTYIITHNYIISPLFSMPRLEIPPDMWELLKLGMGGYIIGRTVEKSVQSWKNN